MGSKALIVYYSLQGSTRKIAEAIHNNTKGQLFEISPEKEYSVASAYTKGIIQATRKTKPPIKNTLMNLNEYETIFIGTPVWAFTMAPPILTFLNQYNLENKKIIPFCTHRGNAGKTIADIAVNCPNSEIMEGKDFYKVSNKDHDYINNEVQKWIQSM